jgi:chromosome segregation ATPase
MNNSYTNLQNKISSIERKVLENAKQISAIDNEMKTLKQEEQNITIQLNNKKLKLVELNKSCSIDKDLLQKSKETLEQINKSIQELSDSI